MGAIDILGYGAGSVDGNASVAAAAAALAAKPGDPGLQAAYDAAYANAVATETAIIPGVGAIFASAAISKDIASMELNGFNPLNDSGAYVSLLGNIAVLAAQGVALVGGGEIPVAIGATTFALADLVDFAGTVLTGFGVEMDSADILSYLKDGASQLGLVPNADGSYNVTGTNNSSFTIGSGNATGTFSASDTDAVPDSGLVVPILDQNGNITGFSTQAPVETNSYSNGGTGYTFNSAGTLTLLTGAQALSNTPNSPTGATPVGSWNIPAGTTSYTVIQYSDGTYGKVTSLDSAGNPVVTMSDVGTPPPGQSNQVVTTDLSGQTSAVISGEGAVDNVSNAAITFAPSTQATIIGGDNTLSGGSSASGSTFTLEGTGTSADTLNLAGATDVTALLGDKTTAIDLGTNTSLTVTSVNGGGTVTGTTGDNVTISGSNVTLDATAGQYSLTGTGDTANASGSTIGTSSNETTAINGSNDVINAASDDSFGLTGVGYTVHLADNSDSLVNFSTNSSGTVTGIGDTIGILATGDTVTASSSTFNFSGSNIATTINGSNDTFNAASNADLGITGTGETVHLDANSDSQVNFTANSQGTVTGATGNDYIGICGTGDNVDASNSTFNFSAGGFSTGIIGNGDTVNAAANSSTGITGTGETIHLAANSDSLVNFGADSQGTVTGASGNDYIGICGTGDNVDASNSTFNFMTTGYNTNVVGSGDTFNTAADSSTGVTGTDETVHLADNSDSIINFGANSQGTVTGASGDDYIGICGTGDSVDASNSTFNFSAGGFSTNVVGSTDTFNEAANSTSTITGTGETVHLADNSDSLVNFGANSSGTVTGIGDTIGVCGNGDGITATDSTFNFLTTGYNTSVVGNGDTFNTAADSTTGITGTGETVHLADNSGSLVDFGANSSGSVTGIGDTIGICGTGDGITATDSTFNFLTTGYNTSAVGNGDTFNTAADSTTGITGTGETVHLADNSGSLVDFGANSSGTVTGIGDTVGICGSGDSITSNSNTFNFAGDDYSTNITGASDLVNAAAGDDFGMSGKGFTVHLADDSGSVVNLDANSGAIVTGIKDTIGILGDNVTVYASGDTINSLASGFTGVVIDGSDDSGNLSGYDYIDNGDDGGGDDGGGDDGGGGYYGGYGFSGNRQTIKSELSGSSISGIAQHDLNQGNTAAAAAAQGGFRQASEMAGDAATSAGNGPNVYEGARWNSETITWSLSPLGGSMSSKYETDVEQAFATWAAASGLKFQEVSGSSQADISIGWGNLNTATTGEVGYTSFHSAAGVISPGANIELENPDLDALVGAPSGNQTYTGTDATLSQTLLHEIGHALGLADNADQGSIMNYDLTSANRTLDTTDLNAIHGLYGSPAGSGAANTQLSALIQAMAGFAPSTAAQTSLSAADSSSAHPLLLAVAH